MSLMLDATVRMSLVVLVALGVTIALARRSAGLRHWVLTAGLVCAGATPLFELALPAWHLDLAAVPSLTQPQASDDVATTAIVLQHASARDAQTAQQPASLRIRTATPSMVVALVWAAGAFISLLMLTLGLARIARIATLARPLRDERSSAMVRRIREATGVRRPVTLLQGPCPVTVATWGAVRPRIMLPAEASQWPDDRLYIVLQHEFAHIARADWLIQMAVEIVRALHWFNPLIWIACRRLRHEAERACDDVVLGDGVEPADYASHLLEIARYATRQRPGPALAMARLSGLEGRVTAMLNSRTPRQPLSRTTRIVVLLAFVAMTVPVAIAQNRFSTFHGTVMDQTNRFVPDAALVLTNANSRAKYEVQTDASGHFEFKVLPSGDYQLAVQKPGFKRFVDDIVIADSDVTRAIQLQIGSVQETVTVVGGPTDSSPDDAENPMTERARQRGADMRQRVQETCGGGPTLGDVGGQILPPLKLTDVRPKYPQSLKAAAVRGVVTLDATIGSDGSVAKMTVVSSPDPELERAAADAVRQWVFSPTFLNCTPIEVPMRVTVSFVPQ